MSLETILERLTEKKRQLEARRPLSASASAKLKAYFDVEWTYHSNAIEGSTLSLRETKVILEDGLTVGGKLLREHLEAVNHKLAIDYVEALAREAQPITERDVRQIHELVLKGIDAEEAGRYRRGQVRISGSEYVPPGPEAVPSLMADFAKWLNTENAELHPIERAAQAHFQLVHIHPFTDGNGRTARLLMNLLLIGAGYPLAILRQEKRLEYYAALDDAHAGNLEPFTKIVAEAVEKTFEVVLEA